MVRPWNEFWNETTSCLAPDGSSTLPVFRENLIAASLASLPELQMNAASASCIEPDSSVFVTNNSDSAPVQGLWYKLEVWTSVCACESHQLVFNSKRVGVSYLLCKDPTHFWITMSQRIDCNACRKV